MRIARPDERDLHEHDPLKPEHQAALDALLSEPTIARAAQRVGVSERTLYRWLERGPVAEDYAKAQRQQVRQGGALLHRYAAHASQVLVSLMADQTVPPAQRIRAAEIVLQAGRQSLELDDLLQRVQALEEQNDGSPSRFATGAA